jgi:hypothetical protein
VLEVGGRVALAGQQSAFHELKGALIDGAKAVTSPQGKEDVVSKEMADPFLRGFEAGIEPFFGWSGQRRQIASQRPHKGV